MTTHSLKIKLVGDGLVKILVLVKKEKFDYWLTFFKKKAKEFDNLQILLGEKEERDTIYNLFELNKNNPFIFVLDLSEESSVLEGFGDRSKGIVERSFGAKQKIGKLNEEYAKWFSRQTEFSVIKIGTKRDDLTDLITKILAYFNGK